MWKPWQWATPATSGRVANARLGDHRAAAGCRLERAEVELYLAARYAGARALACTPA